MLHALMKLIASSLVRKLKIRC
uniref:Uncharacterized protein n=1 Tax=Arundo donax TaxID=35708 RepID=A0A0A8YQ91_ARUDO